MNSVTDTEVGNIKDLDILIPMYNFKDYSDSYTKRSGSLL